jgi:uncharacterized protein (TIGR03067 family)
MNVLPRQATLGLVILGLVVTATSAADSPPGDLDKLRGSWQMVLLERDGALVATGTTFVTIDGAAVTTSKDGKSVETGRLALDPSTSPRRYDFTITADSTEAGRTFPGIYRLEGDTFETCVAVRHDGTRPTSFVTEPDSGTQRIVWRRIGSMLDAPR